MGEVVRLVLERLVLAGVLFEGILDDGIPLEERPEPFFLPGSFPTKYISEILGYISLLRLQFTVSSLTLFVNIVNSLHSTLLRCLTLSHF